MNTLFLKIMILFSIVISNLSFAQVKRELTFSTIEYCPLICKNTEKPGILVEVLKKAFAPYGIKIEVKLFSLARAIILATDGNTDGMIGGNQLQAPKLIFPKTVTLNQYIKIFQRVDSNWKYENSVSLEKIRFGAITGYDYVDAEINKYIKTSKTVIQINQKQGPKHLIHLLLLRRIDAFVAGHLIANYYIGQGEVGDQVKELDGTFGKFQNYISLSPKLENVDYYLKILDNETLKLRKNGFYNSLLKKYNVNDSIF